MGKTRNKERSETEYLRGKNKKLETENRALKKRIRQLDKRAHFFDELVEGIAEEVIEPVTEKCPSCFKGDLKILDLSFIKYICCDQCDYRKKTR